MIAPDPAAALLRAIAASAACAGCPVALIDDAMRPWASATFLGARHRVTLGAAASPAFDAWLIELPEADLPIAGHLVADLRIDHRSEEGDDRRITLDILTIATG